MRCPELLPLVLLGLSAGLTQGCTTVDPGQDFAIPDIVFDEGYFYCRVEPMLVAQRCGSGDGASGDATGGCHYNVTSFRLTEYSPLVADSCQGGAVPTVSPPAPASANYQTSQSRMQRDPERAPLLLRPTGVARHPRVIFPSNSAEADLIRVWADQFSTQ